MKPKHKQAFDFDNTPASGLRPVFDYFPDSAEAPVVTIVTPFYNTGGVFHETARSVLRQSLQQWEWVIVNDGSTEPAALAILDHYREADPRIRIIYHHSNLGLPAARNTGFKHASTPYVALLDSDDLLEPTALEKWRWFLEAYPEYAFVKGYTVGFGAQEYLWTKGFHHGKEILKENLGTATSMIRKAVHTQVGGYDESLRDGLEDWDFWLRCAHAGHWGATLPEYGDWYRRRSDHAGQWEGWDGGRKQRALVERFKQRYRSLWQEPFPKVEPRWHMPHDSLPDDLPFSNPLVKRKPRLLLVLPWLATGGADKFNLDVLEQLTRRGWEITIATTLAADNPQLSAFSRYTPDIFILANFLRLVDFPRFLRYLVQSRSAEAILISNSELGYMLVPYLRACLPGVPILDMAHMEEDWKNGGYPRQAVEYQELLDLNLVSSEHLRDWMIARGASREKIRVLYTNVDTQKFQPDPARALDLRHELKLKPGVLVILFAARLVEQKQPRLLAKVLRALRDRHVRFVALVAGAGPDYPWLNNYIHDHHLGRQVRLLGLLPNAEVQELLLAADVFFLPSAMEGIALTLYEAMASGLPVVAARVGGQAELVTPETGVLVEHGEDEQAEIDRYVEALTRLAANPEERRRMGAAGRARVVAGFQLTAMVDQLEGLLAEAQSRRAADILAAPAPSTRMAHTAAALAVEYTRLFNLSEQLWHERELAYTTSTRRGLGRGWLSRKQLYFLVRSKFGRAYEWGLAHHWYWLETLKDKVKMSLIKD